MDVRLDTSAGMVGDLWSAIHALEEQACGGRWRRNLPGAQAYRDAMSDKADREAGLLRGVLEEQAPTDTNWGTRPSGPPPRQASGNAGG
jgi:hypothetical protein